MTLGNFRLPSTRTPHAMKGAAVFVACLAVAAIGCNSTKRSTPTTFAKNPMNANASLPMLATTQNPVPIDLTIHVYGPNKAYAFGQQFIPTSVIDPKQRGDLQRGSDSGPRGFVAAPIKAGSDQPFDNSNVDNGQRGEDDESDGESDGESDSESDSESDGESDGIRVGDDGFPNDPLRNAPRMYGCGVADRDSDNGTAVEALLCSSTHFFQVCASSQNTVSATTNTSTSTTSSQVKP